MTTDTDMYALSIITENRAGVLRDVATVMADYRANIQMIQQSIITTGLNTGKAYLYFEFEECGNHGELVADLARFRPSSTSPCIRRSPGYSGHG